MLKLRKNNWSSESYKFDEVLSENSSQKRVYEVVAKPVVEVIYNYLHTPYLLSTHNSQLHSVHTQIVIDTNMYAKHIPI